MEEEKPKHAGGRPATGVTPKRDIRMGPTWDESVDIAAELGEPFSAYVRRALETANAKHRKRLKESLAKESGIADETAERWRKGK